MNSLENKFPFSQLRLVAAIGLFAATQSLYAAEIAGRVNFVSGNAFVTTPQNQQRNVFKGDLIYAGEKIETARNSRIQIKMTDGGTIVLRPSSTFEITQYSFSKDTPELGTVLYNFIKGGARAVSGAIGKVNKQNYKFNTPIATIGIRGTDYSATLDNDKLTTTVTDGKININNPQGDEDADEGETYVTYRNKKPVLCHTTNKDTKKPITETCEPVFISLDAEESLAFAKQKIKKPTLENFASYGAFTEAMRRYKSLEQEVERIENANSEEIANFENKEPSDSHIATINPLIELEERVNSSRFNTLELSEMSDFSVGNAIGLIEEENSDLSITDDINKKDILLNQVFRYRIDENLAIDNTNRQNQLTPIDITELLESLFQVSTDNFLGNNTNIIGADIGNPQINVVLGQSLFDAINIQLTATTRNKDYLLNLGVKDDVLLQKLDANNNGMFGGLSIRQGLLHDNDGISENKNSGSILIGNGSPEQSTVVFSDDNTPVLTSLSLADGFRASKYSELANRSALVISLNTPKLVIKLGNIYVSDSDSSAAGINKDGGVNLGSPEVLGTSQDGATPVEIMGPSTIVLGEATIKAKLEHTPKLLTRRIDDILVNPSLAIYADAFIKSGINIYNIDIKDVGGSLKGGSLMLDRLTISDNGSNNLTAKLAVHLETFENQSTSKSLGFSVTGIDDDSSRIRKETLGGIVLSLNQLGHILNGVDLSISNARVGSADSPTIGDIQVIGLNINGTKVIIRGH